MGAWDVATCCRNATNQCKAVVGVGSCYDITSSGDFIFGLGPETPAKFAAKNDVPLDDKAYQYMNPLIWGDWGCCTDIVLHIGSGYRLGTDGFCNQGHNYEGKPNQICGGSASSFDHGSAGRVGGSDWGETEMETWRLVATVQAAEK